MAERMNCFQNQVTIANRVLLKNKAVGCVFPQFPFIAHSRGWTAEDMEANVAALKKSESLRQGAADLVDRAMALTLDTHVQAAIRGNELRLLRADGGWVRARIVDRVTSEDEEDRD